MTSEKVLEFRSLFLRGKVFCKYSFTTFHSASMKTLQYWHIIVCSVYTGKVISEVQGTGGDRTWIIEEMKQFKSKRAKMLLVQLKNKGKVRLIAGKCECPRSLQPGTQYLFAVRAGVRRKKLRLPTNKDGNDFIISLSHASEIGLLWSGLLKQSWPTQWKYRRRGTDCIF